MRSVSAHAHTFRNKAPAGLPFRGDAIGPRRLPGTVQLSPALPYERRMTRFFRAAYLERTTYPFAFLRLKIFPSEESGGFYRIFSLPGEKNGYGKLILPSFFLYAHSLYPISVVCRIFSYGMIPSKETSIFSFNNMHILHRYCMDTGMEDTRDSRYRTE